MHNFGLKKKEFGGKNPFPQPKLTHWILTYTCAIFQWQFSPCVFFQLVFLCGDILCHRNEEACHFTKAFSIKWPDIVHNWYILARSMILYYYTDF